MAIEFQYRAVDGAIAEAMLFLEARGLLFGRDFVESNAIAIAGSLLLTEGFGPATFRRDVDA